MKKTIGGRLLVQVQVVDGRNKTHLSFVFGGNYPRVVLTIHCSSWMHCFIMIMDMPLVISCDLFSTAF